MLNRRIAGVLARACRPAAALVAGLAAAQVPAAPAPSPGPVAGAPASGATAAAPDEIHSLVSQLGDPDFRKREAAARQLTQIGKPAAPALREALAGRDPEVCSRADALLRQIEHPRLPAGWFRDFTDLRRREGFMNGSRVVEVMQGGRRLFVSEGPGGIEMNVTGVDGSDLVDVTVKARDPEDLRRQDPEAFALYERVAGPRANLNLRGRRLMVPPPMMPAPMPPVPLPQPRGARLLPLAPQGAGPRPPADDLLGLEARLRQQMRGAQIDEAEQHAVLDALRMLREIQARGAEALPQDLDAQVRKYNALSDAVRKKLEELKLPGPGDALPPPARARLGVSVAPPDGRGAGAAGGGVTVTMVIPKGRGETLGLMAGDVIRRVNGKSVDDAAALRRALTDAKGPIVLDVIRGGEPQTLREQAQ